MNSLDKAVNHAYANAIAYTRAYELVQSVILTYTIHLMVTLTIKRGIPICLYTASSP